jgi:hypothetical protein
MQLLIISYAGHFRPLPKDPYTERIGCAKKVNKSLKEAINRDNCRVSAVSIAVLKIS